MERYEIHITPRALKDLRQIAAYITGELQQPDTAREVVNKIEEGIQSLGKMPERFAKVKDRLLALRGIRKVQVGNYLIFYIIEEPAVHVIAILYERRDWHNIL